MLTRVLRVLSSQRSARQAGIVPEVLRRGLVVLHGPVQVPGLGLQHLGDGLVMLGSDGESAILCVDVDSTLDQSQVSIVM